MAKINLLYCYWRGQPVVILEIQEGLIFVDRIDAIMARTLVFMP